MSNESERLMFWIGHDARQVKIFLGGTAEMAFRVPKAERHRLIEPVR
jgi:hypothetical protein